MKLDFSSLGIREEILKQLKEEGIVNPTPIQEQAIPVALQGKDIVAQAQTGTGKTFAFMLPILEKINPNQKDVQALILAPTRELALQITTEAKKLAAEVGVNVVAIYGGQDVERQIHKLKGGMHIVVATPGRLLDHLRRGTIHLKGVSKLVLDEADQMLTMGFLEEVEFIIKKTPPTRQLMFFSATIPKGIRSLTNRYMKGPVEIRIKSNKVTLEEIRQIVVETTDRHKQAALVEMIKQQNPFLAIVFCRTKRRAKELNNSLIDLGFACDELHGDMTQNKREKVMKTFRNAKLQILVATDVAARGLDVEGITHIFNYDIPNDVESYIHRIGRTGRAGEKGIAITFVAPKDREFLGMIEKGTNQRIEKTIYKPEGRVESIEATFERAAKKKEFNSSRDRSSDRDRGRGRSKTFDKNKKDFSGSNRRDNDRKDGTRTYDNDRKEGTRTYGNDRKEGNTSYGRDRKEGNTSYGRDKKEGNTSYGRDRKEGNASYGRDKKEGNTSYSRDKKEGNTSYGRDKKEGNASYGNDRKDGKVGYDKDKKAGSAGYGKDRNEGNKSYANDRKNPRYGASTNKGNSRRGNK